MGGVVPHRGTSRWKQKRGHCAPAERGGRGSERGKTKMGMADGGTDG